MRIYYAMDGVKLLQRMFQGVNGKATCVMSRNPDEVGLTWDELITRGYVEEPDNPSKMILVEAIMEE